MKILIVFTLALFSINSFAKSNGEKSEWKEAKKTCLTKDSSLKGKKLKKCIKEEMKSEESGETKSEEKSEKEKM